MSRSSLRHVHALFLVLATGFGTLSASPAGAETYTCVCANGCGNGGIGANAGAVRTGQPANKLRDWYGLDGPGESRTTGWTCVVETTYECKCSSGCGNGAIGGNRGQVHRNVSATDAIQRYGAWRGGRLATGWSCSAQAGSSSPPSAPVWSGNLNGDWQDSEGRKIDIDQSGDRVVATMVSASGQRWWTRGEGTISGDTLDMTHTRNGSRTDRQQGRLRGSGRIEWGNGTVWTRTSAAPTTPTRPNPGLTRPWSGNLSGDWRDSEGRSISMTQNGNEVRARMESPSGRRWWNEGSGRIEGDQLSMTHRKNGRETDRQRGRLYGSDRIEWSNGTTWRRHQPIETQVYHRADGYWRDLQGHEISLSESSGRLTVTMETEAGRRWWDGANGSRRGNDLSLNHTRQGRVVDRVEGRLRSDDRIEWANGTSWTRIARLSTTPPVPPTWSGNLSGYWRDADGNKIHVNQNDGEVSASRPTSPGSDALLVADGRISGDRLVMEKTSSWSELSEKQATLGASDRIEWTHGPAWVRWVDGPVPGREVSVVVSCSSDKKRRRTCTVPGWILGASVKTRHSRSGCDEGRDWGWQGSDLWVDNGCRADFTVRHDDSGVRTGGGSDSSGGRSLTPGELLVGAILESAGVDVFEDGDSGSSQPHSDGGSPAPPVEDPDSEAVHEDWTDLVGAWEDGYSSRINVEQAGDHVRALMLSPEGRQWWTHAEGTVHGSSIQMDQNKNGRDAGRRLGRVEAADEIEWDDGQVWRRVSTKPWSDEPPSRPRRVDLSGDWRDGYGRELSLTQDGLRVRARMVDSDGKRWWTDAEGRLESGELELSYFRRGRSVDEQKGRVVGEDRIEWPDGLSWTRLSQGSDWQPSSSRVDLGGDWHDSYGQDIRLEQEGRRLRATMLGTSGQRWWSTGQGRLEQGRIEMELFRRGRSVDDLTGRLTDENRIEWNDGTEWHRGHRH